MAAGDTKADLDLLANFADDIDLEEIGLEQSEIDNILNIAYGGVEKTVDLFADLMTPTKAVPEKGSEEYEANKARVKAGKAKTREMAKEGKIRIWQYPLIRSLGEYISRSYVGNGWTVNFADASAKTVADPYLVFRYGQQTGSENMMQLAKALYSGHPMRSTDVFRVLSSLKARQDMAHIEARTAHEPFTWYPETEVGYLRNEDMVLAVKGGYNAESHNHNDAGTFSLYCFGYPVFIDIGVGTYTRQTFGKERYSIWTMQSQYHNLPLINGQGQKDGRKYRASGTTCITNCSNDITLFYILTFCNSVALKVSVTGVNTVIVLNDYLVTKAVVVTYIYNLTRSSCHNWVTRTPCRKVDTFVNVPVTV